MSRIPRCPRAGCGGQILEGTCLLCARSVVKPRLDRTPPEVAEATEAALLKGGKHRPKSDKPHGMHDLWYIRQPAYGVAEHLYAPQRKRDEDVDRD